MSRKFEYKTFLIKGRQSGLFAEFPFDSVTEFGTRKPVRVKVTFNGLPFFMSLLPNGKGGHWLHLKKEIRQEIGKEEGDKIEITVELDTSPKKVEIPDYLQWLLNEDAEIKSYFEKLPFSAKKFWIGFITEPKNDESKAERINRFFEYLSRHYSGKK